MVQGALRTCVGPDAQGLEVRHKGAAPNSTILRTFLVAVDICSSTRTNTPTPCLKKSREKLKAASADWPAMS